MPDENYKRLGCADCGAPIWKGSTRCMPCAKPPVLERACAGCGLMFKPKPGGNKGLYCSRECAYANINQWRSADLGGGAKGYRKYPDKQGPFCKVFFKVCDVCGKAFTTGFEKKLSCSKDCTYSSQLAKLRNKYECAPETLRPCGTCGLLFKSNKASSKYCSPDCKPRKNNHRSRARHAGVVYEPVNTIRVLERDGWRCQICGKDTPRNRRGSRYSNAPELDHRIPFALGGPHTYANVQCACRACNLSKGGTIVVGQVPLFG